MASGKSFAGKQLAERLQFDFVDLDAAVERQTGRTIAELFADRGEEAFRRVERDALRATAGRSATVIATGGGAPCFHGGMNWMNAHGTTVFLDPPLAVLLPRLLAGRAHRPLLRSATKLEAEVAARLSARRPVYEKAQIHLRPTDPKAETARLLSVYFSQPGY